MSRYENFPNRTQIEALYSLWTRRSTRDLRSYLQFRRSCVLDHYDAIIVPDWCGMTVGIETDGYTHT